MAVPEKDLRLIRKNFENSNEVNPERIRLGNHFVDDFIFEGHEAADIPINALRVIFNIVSTISNEQFRPEDRPKQLSLFDEEFETENNIFASIKIRNNKISPSGSTKQVVDAYEFLTKFKMSWYKSTNSKGKEIKTFGGLISIPSYDQRGYTTFLISSYWLKKLMVIPEYNYVLYNLVYNIRNNKHIIFAIWLAKLPENGAILKLSTLNKKFGLKYKTSKDFCFKFLKPARISLNRFNTLSFNYKYRGDSIFIIPYLTKTILDNNLSRNTREQLESSEAYLEHREKIGQRLSYIRKRYGLHENEMLQFSHQYRNVPQTRVLIEKAFKEFIRTARLNEIKSTEFQGKLFLNEIQEHLIQIYRRTKMGELLPNGYPIII
ncbi:hypothetical protein NAL32_02450 [Chryseobacterium sp. Ch-15]|uniref:Initiator Rep protein domain-containing protein n=1 Tax=Chryseobacterium muglaense TaxID=2893752 RepID=A0A9Q3UX49_9FLAO|nr:hypothetical protein [Chryseobacterium muglaense]MBD3903354.1 hypothetical protein [Chryseobacterium muglaense]MCC9036182.1 hypothetical protein [Chryseobacterium muglaense]MCM2553243.1 hypothetical protein [Chryseobacterium muglaense]